MQQETLRCLEVSPGDGGHPVAAIVQRACPTPGDGEVLIKVRWSSLNYKDALAATGNRAVVAELPRVPGIDAAGIVVASRAPGFAVGDEVIVTSYDLGVGHDGGWSEYICVPAQWIVPLPSGLSLLESMILGTAGLTVGLCLHALQQHSILPGAGKILVTGATGGVGSLAVRLLAHLGYHVVAVSGKGTMAAMLTRFGAREVLSRECLADDSKKPMLKPHWAGVVDCVGGSMLVNAIRQTAPFGCVAACGLVGGAELPLTIYPFILRGITLAGIDSAYCPHALRSQIWQRLATDWKPPHLDEGVSVVTLEALPLLVARMLRGESSGRIVVSLAAQ